MSAKTATTPPGAPFPTAPYARFKDAHQRFLSAPATLSGDDLEALRWAGPFIVERAAERAAGFIGRDPREATAPVTVGALVDQILPVILARCRALEQRVAEIEARPQGGAQWAGVFDTQKSYEPGQLVTCHGGLWLVTRPTERNDRPGSSDAFRLVVKSGAFAGGART
jgi:hypothetical protein